MQHLYIDESGSMTAEHTERWPCFTIAIVSSDNKERAKRAVRRFVSKNFDAIKKDDAVGKMFDGESFRELKGSCMSEEIQTRFINFMCRDDTVRVFFILVRNEHIKYGLYKNTARAFNYILGQALYNILKAGLLPKDSYMLHIDERNQKTGTIHTLEEYLNIHLCLDNELADEIKVQYYDSAENSLIQVADVFSNAYYKHCMKNGNAGSISAALNKKNLEGYFPAVYEFPQKIIKIAHHIET